MKWKWMAALLPVALGLLLIPGNRSNQFGNKQPDESMNPNMELTVKQAIVESDVKQTEALCRTECSISLKQTVDRLPNDGAPAEISAKLDSLRRDHPHMESLVWTKRGQRLDDGVRSGSLDAAIVSSLRPFIEQAKQTAETGREFHSAPIATVKGPYFVMGIPDSGRNGVLVGAVHQRILNTVRNHQTKNLHVVPYPAGGHYKIESVDSGTLRNKQVVHPEDNEGTSHYHKNEVVVKFNRPITDAEFEQMRRDIKAISIRKLGYTYVFRSNEFETKPLMDYFKRWPIEYVEPHFLYVTNDVKVTSSDLFSNPQGKDAIDPPMSPNDQLYNPYQWNLPIITTTNGWNIGKGSADVIVGIVDTGVDMDHSDLKDHVLSGYNVIEPSNRPMDDVGHGTHVAGVISALVNNEEGVAGMTWYNPVLPVKVLDSSGAGNTYNVAQGIIWATDHGAKVINMSLGNYANAQFLHDAIKYAFDHDVVLVAAAGNDNSNQPSYPAAYPEVISVAATDNNKNKAPFSNYGDYISVSAPGVSIASTFPNGQYAALSGTSMASPHVAALAALIRSANPALKNTEVMDIIKNTADDLGDPGKDIYFGYGQINVDRALRYVGQTTGSVDQTSSNQDQAPNWLERLSEEFFQFDQK